MKNEGEGKREARLSRPLQVNRRPAPLGPSVYQSVQDVQRLSSDATGKKKKIQFPTWLESRSLGTLLPLPQYCAHQVGIKYVTSQQGLQSVHFKKDEVQLAKKSVSC